MQALHSGMSGEEYLQSYAAKVLQGWSIHFDDPSLPLQGADQEQPQFLGELISAMVRYWRIWNFCQCSKKKNEHIMKYLHYLPAFLQDTGIGVSKLGTRRGFAILLGPCCHSVSARPGAAIKPWHMVVSIRVPNNGWFIMENTIYKWVIWQYPYFRKSPNGNMWESHLSMDMLTVYLSLYVRLLKGMMIVLVLEAQ